MLDVDGPLADVTRRGAIALAGAAAVAAVVRRSTSPAALAGPTGLDRAGVGPAATGSATPAGLGTSPPITDPAPANDAAATATPASTPTAPTTPAPTAPTTPTGPGTSPTPLAVTGDVRVPSLPLTPTEEDAVHLLRRATFGPTEQSIAEVRTLGVEAWLLDQFARASLPDRDLRARLAGFRTLDRSPREVKAFAELPGMGHLPPREIRYATLLHAVYARAQLREVMVDVWSNHFHTDLGKGWVRFAKAAEVAGFRTHAFGRFGTLLRSSAQSPAMLVYLDNHRSRMPEPNENYGRELLELHTVGVDGGYDESDVLDCARTFTGWTLDDLAFRFEPKWHHEGPVSVLGWSSPGMAGPGAGEQGLALLDHLATHPSTARHVSRRLVSRFVADDPPASLVDRCATVFLRSGGDIPQVLRTIFLSGEFWSSQGAKVRRPFDALPAALRAAGADLASDISGEAGDTAAKRTEQALAAMGQRLFDWDPPTGYPDAAPYWATTQGLMARWQQLARLARGDDAWLRLDADRVSGPRSTAGSLVDHTCRAVLHRPPTDAERTMLADFLGLVPGAEVPEKSFERARQSVLGLALCSPDFQVR